MRPSERLAAFSVFAMTVPAALAFPALGLWYVAKIWPGMGSLDRVLFCCALALFFVSLSFGFKRGVRRVKQGCPDTLAPVDRFLMLVSYAMGGWALTHRLNIVAFALAWGCWTLYDTYRKQDLK